MSPRLISHSDWCTWPESESSSFTAVSLTERAVGNISSQVWTNVWRSVRLGDGGGASARGGPSGPARDPRRKDGSRETSHSAALPVSRLVAIYIKEVIQEEKEQEDQL